jgi:hypothetical protein
MADAALPPPRLYLPYEDGAFRLALGVTALREADWFEMDCSALAQLPERRRLLAERRADVLAALPGSEAACAELAAMAEANLAEFHPGWPGRAEAAEGSPLEMLGHRIADDFCLLQPSPEGPRLIAAVLCFPARWRLAEKLGRPMMAIHTSVPGYSETLGRPVDRFMTTLKAGRIAARFNWTVQEDPTLYQPQGHGRSEHDPSVTPENAGETMWLRVERQTFRLLPESGVITFGIRTHVTPLSLVARDPGEAGRLGRAVRGIPPEMARYKSLLPYRDALLAFLDDRAAAAAAAAAD